MISTSGWKECRLYAVAFPVVAAAAGLALAVGQELESAKSELAVLGPLLALVALGISWVHGVACGAMLLAGKRVDATLASLGPFPSLRSGIWKARCLAGIGLVLAQALAVAVIVAGLYDLLAVVPMFQSVEIHGLENDGKPIVGMRGLAVAGFMGLGWGLLFSAGGAGLRSALRLAPGPALPWPTPSAFERA